MKPLELEFQLSDREFERAWIAEYFRRPSGALRTLAGPLVAALGLFVATRATDGGGRSAGALLVALGLWQLARAFVLARALVGKRRATGAASRTMRVHLDDAGIAVSDGKKETRVPWDGVTGAGRGGDYVWFEVRGSARGTIPLRAIADPAALESIFRDRGKWAGPRNARG
jgi:hypothetical protein